MTNLFWYLPPLFILVSLVYSGTRYDAWPAIVRDAIWWQTRLLIFLGILGLCIFLFSWFF